MNVRKYLVLLAVMCFGSIGDALLSRGMKQLGPVNLHHWQEIIRPIGNPWILIGILCLTVFFASYLTALSFADLSYVLPATAFGYVLVTLIAKFLFHENVSLLRWLGVLLISCGVGWVTRGPALTEHPREATASMQKEQHEVA
ncbi:MAG TPA: EamA family transporter [Candidatus Angelobacter sp.]|nr:EamA family transporter [Candidatus Angelobacter sp.]